MPPLRAIAVAVLALISASSSARGTSLNVSMLVPAPPQAGGAPLFQEIPPAETGFGFVSELQPDHPRAYLYRAAFACGGVAIGDVDGDGLPDLFCTGGAGKNALFRQFAPAAHGTPPRFEATTDQSPGLDGGDAWGTGCSLADIDGDGDLDLYLCRYDEPNALFLNDGKGRFLPPKSPTGLEIHDASHTPAFADYDGDGDLDLYLLTNRFEDPAGYRGKQALTLGKDGKPAVKKGYERYYEAWFTDFDNWGINASGREDYLLRNEGTSDDGTPRFVDVTAKAGISGRGDGNSVTWWDYDLDGDLDLYVGNDFISPDKLYRNDGDGTFTDIAATALPHTSWFSMGADFADLNGDGLPEFLISDMSATNHFKQKTTMGVMGGSILRRANTSQPPQYMRNAFFLNTGSDHFLEAAQLSGIESSDWTWSVLFGDFDLDGAKDAYFSNGTPRAMNDSDLTLSADQLAVKHEWEYVKHYPPRAEKNRSFRNAGGLRFEDTSDAWGLGKVGVSYGGAYGDLDRDGDLDLVVLNVGGQASLYLNQADNPNRIAVQLTGTASDRHGTGARIVLHAGGAIQEQQIIPDRGFMGRSDTVACFGLGDAKVIDLLEVFWPSGAYQKFGKLDAGKRYTITEPEGPTTKPPSPGARSPLFAQGDPGLRAHEDPVYNDFQHQSLLPNALSALGPASAWGDIDGDGDDDLFAGGGAGQAGVFYQNNGGKLSPLANAALTTDAQKEDMGAVFIDSDSDGDLDLFVASGSYEFPAGDKRLQNRLYINDGKGAFSPAPAGAVPDTAASSSCAIAGDLDGDGDLDLFVGGRVVPRAYPTTPQSQLLRNDGGTFTDITAAAAPGLAATGLVTAALWTDADGDRDADLLVAHEWGPVKLYQNDGGKLSDATAASGIAGQQGWWNSIAGRDLDGDGDIDYVVGNQGLNTKYHASAKKPVELYYGDYHGDGKNCIVEAEWEGDTLYPVRGKSCSTRAMPQLGDKFKTFKSFAAASLEEIYAPPKLDSALQLKATTLESTALINDGSGRFTPIALPRLAQISPVFGIAIGNFDDDPIPDLFLAQNFFGPQEETGRYDGGRGMLLTGNGDGTFKAMPAIDSGVLLSGDMTSATLADLDGDASPEILVSRNATTPALLKANQGSTSTPIAIRLAGAPGNPVAVGALVTVVSGDSKQTAEVHAGCGYLGSRSPALFFNLSAAGSKGGVSVAWPDGETTKHPLPASGTTTTISR